MSGASNIFSLFGPWSTSLPINNFSVTESLPSREYMFDYFAGEFDESMAYLDSLLDAGYVDTAVLKEAEGYLASMEHFAPLTEVAADAYGLPVATAVSESAVLGIAESMALGIDSAAAVEVSTIAAAAPVVALAVAVAAGIGVLIYELTNMDSESISKVENQVASEKSSLLSGPYALTPPAFGHGRVTLPYTLPSNFLC